MFCYTHLVGVWLSIYLSGNCIRCVDVRTYVCMYEHMNVPPTLKNSHFVGWFLFLFYCMNFVYFSPLRPSRQHADDAVASVGEMPKRDSE